MSETRKDQGLTTKDLAATMPSQAPAPAPHPGPREYDEGPPKKTAPAPKPAGQPPEKKPEPAMSAAGRPEDQGLLPKDDGRRLHDEWNSVQIGFVDEPRRSVEKADKLVADVIQRLARVFSEERTRLENQWDKGEDVSTEDLRVALQRYRSFFDRLLSV